VKEGEHSSANVNAALSPKLKPNHVYGRVVKVLEAGRYLMKLEGMTKCVPKHRKQLISRCKEEVMEQEILDRNPVMLPEDFPVSDMDESDSSVSTKSPLVHHDVQKPRSTRMIKRPQRIFGQEFHTELGKRGRR